MNKKLKEVLDIFTEINTIPRKSKNEEKISEWLVSWAIKNGLEVERDEFLDVLIKVPGTKGYENRDTVILQGHMDMVCEKNEDSNHDFLNDPIDMYIEDGWLKARGTSLGADNGIALAMALALVTDSEVKHPPLELLFTVDEETGLTGAVNLKSNWLTGKKLINIDSEDEGVFTIGCAGGRDANIYLQKEPVSYVGDSSLYIEVKGLKGGHSGVDIHQEKANANIILARLLKEIEKSEIKLGIVDISGGSAHNAIPRFSSSVISIEKRDIDQISEIINSFAKTVKSEFEAVEPDMEITFTEKDKSESSFSLKIIDLILSLPHGVMYNSKEMDGVVETSSNVAVVSTDNDSFSVLMSQRSSIMSRLDEICQKIDSVVRLSGGSVEFGCGYPAWQPNFKSEILEDFTSIYKKMYKKKPVIEVIHAGLECGVIGSKYPGMEMISIGPTIKNPHSPDEKMEVATILDIWNLLVEYLKIK